MVVSKEVGHQAHLTLRINELSDIGLSTADEGEGWEASLNLTAGTCQSVDPVEQKTNGFNTQ